MGDAGLSRRYEAPGSPAPTGWAAPVTVANGERRLTGVFEGLDEEGALVLAQPGAELSIAAGDVHFGDAEAAHAARG